MKTILATISFIIGIELLYLAYRLIVRKEFRPPLYIALGVIALMCAPWTIAYGIMYSTSDPNIAFLAYHIGAFGWTLGMSCWFLFFYELDNYISAKKRNILVHLVSWAIGFVFLIAAADGSLYAVQLQYTAWWGWEETIKKGSFWVITYNAVIALMIIITIFRIRHTLRNAKSKKQMHLLKLIGASFTIVTIPAVLINLIAPFLDMKSIPPFGHFLLSVIALVIGRIVMLYRVLDISPTMAASQILFEISDYVFLTDLFGNIRKISNVALTILDVNSNHLINRNISEITNGLKAEDLIAKSGMTFKTELISKNDIAIPVRCKVTLVNDAYDDPIGYLLVMADLRDMIAIEDLENAVQKRTSELEEKNRKLSEEILERKKIEGAVISVEEKQRAMISNISDVIAIVNSEGRIIYNTSNLESILGWKADDVFGLSAFQAVHPEDLETMTKFFIDIKNNMNSTKTLELRLKCKDGEYKVVHLTAVNKLQDPYINGILINYHDITERVEAEKERQLKADRIQKQQEALLRITKDDSIKQGDKESSFKFITETAADTLDVERVSIWFFSSDGKEINCADLFKKSDRMHSTGPSINLDQYTEYIKMISEGLTIKINDALTDEKTSGFRESYLMPLGVTSLLDAGIRISGRLIGILSFGHTGITRTWRDDETAFAMQLADLVTQSILYGERKTMVDKLRLFAYTIRSVSENVSITDMDDKLIFINESFCKTYGYNESELLGKTVEILRANRHQTANVKSILPKTKDGGWEGELWNKKKDGTEFLIHLSTSIIKDEQDKSVALVGIATDITERRKAEEKLFSLLRFQSEMLDTAAMWINTLDVNGNITFWNKAAEKISGYSKEELLNNDKIWGLLYPDPAYKKKIYDTIASINSSNKKVENFQTIIRRRDGEKRIISWYSNSLADENGKIAGSIAIGIDNTERNRAEETLRENEEKYRILLDESRDPIFSFSPEGRYIYANRAFVTGVEKTVEQVVGKTIWDVFDKEDADKRFAAVKSAFETGEENVIEVRVPRSDGDTFYITSLTPIKNKEGKVITVICSSKDITERKRTEDVLRLSEQKMRLHFEQTPLGVIEWDRNYCVVSWNHSAELIFGYTAEEAAGKHADYFLPEKIRAQMNETLAGLLTRKGASRGCNENLTRNGDTILCEWYNTALTAGDGEVIGVTSLVMDVTDRQIAEEEQSRLLEELRMSRAKIEDEAIKLAILNEQLTESEKKLKELNASKDKFFSIIAHDLKSPFLSLLGYSEILSKEFDYLSEDEKKESIAGIYELSNSSYKLLENLLQWSRIQIGKVDFYPEPFNLHYELSPAILLLSQTAKNKNIGIEDLIDSKTFITADKNMLNTIVRNLISNSIKFCNKGGKIIISSKEEENYIEISVKDNGVGMDETQLENLFSIDKNSSTKGTANETGTGLGLLLCKEMIEKHGGVITTVSKPGKGSEFRFTIPRK